MSAAPHQPASVVHETDRVTAEATPPAARKPAPKRVWLLPAVVLVVVATVVGLDACSQIGGTIAPSPTDTAAPSPAATAEATQTRSPTPTATAEPTQTPSPTPAAPLTPEAGATAMGPNGMVLVYVPEGLFTMGSQDGDPDAWDNEKPQQQVDVDGFWIARTEVTNAQYLRCVEAGACPQPENADYRRSEFADRPVTGVTWHAANAYAEWVGGRLPTEAEWEKACRGVDGRIYPWGNAAPTAELLNFNEAVGHTTDAGSYPPGTYGLFDMAGNVWEWTATVYKPYPHQGDDGRADPRAEGGQVVRGGSAYDDRRSARCAVRYGSAPDYFLFNIGFRVVASPSPSGVVHAEMLQAMNEDELA